jgi:hypothetical protein
MRPLSAFSLHVEPTSESRPACVSIAVSSSTRDHLGVLRLTPDCMTLDELEGCINALQDELDVLRAEARRTFTGGTVILVP